jgi:hypothetical protein
MSVPSYSRWLRHRTTYRQCIPPCLKDSTARSQHTRPTIVNSIKHVRAPCIALESFNVSFLVISLPYMRTVSFFWGGGAVNFIQITRTLITAGCTSTAAFLSVRTSSLFRWPFTGRVLPIASTATLRSCCKQPQRRTLPLWPGFSGCHRASSSADRRASHLAGTIHGHRGLCEQGSTRNQTDKRLKFASLETASQTTENKNIQRKSPPLSWCTFVRNTALKHP